LVKKIEGILGVKAYASPTIQCQILNVI
jgi:hypothetical protein